MATRTGVPGTTAGGNIWTSANVNNLPGGVIAYSKVTANNTGITTITDLVTITFTAPGSRLYMIHGHAGLLTKNTSSGLTKVFFRDTAAATINVAAEVNMVATDRMSVNGFTYDAPSSGSTEYRLSALTSGANDVDLSANAFGSDPGPTYILVQDVGPSF